MIPKKRHDKFNTSNQWYRKSPLSIIKAASNLNVLHERWQEQYEVI